MSPNPAWSELFEYRRQVAATALPSPITPGWAWDAPPLAPVKVAILDSGIEEDHPAIGPIAGGAAFERDADAPGGVLCIDGPHGDLAGHGTACAGIIRRVAPEAELFSVRVLSASMSGNGAVFAAGIRWALDNDMRVLNLALGTTSPRHVETLSRLVDEAYFKGVIVVAAANNEPVVSYPAAFSSVLSVACHPGKDPFGFSYNPTGPVEFGAPGLHVEVAWPVGLMRWATGNSFAAPHLTGLVARLLARHPALTPFQVRGVLYHLADNVVSTDETGA